MALINCHECQKEISDQAPACPHCGAPVKKPEIQEEKVVHKTFGMTKPKKGELTAFLLFVAIGAFLFCGFFHIVQSSQNGLFLVKKAGFTLSETFVNLDAINGIPYIVAIQKYPLAIKAMQKAGYLESDEAREARVQQEINEKTKEYMKNLGY